MKKNVSSQVIGAQMVSATDGSAFTSAVTVYVCGDAGVQAAGSVGSGACTHEGNGYHTYAPAQAETNYDLIAFTFTGTGAVPATVQVFTGYPQTGDNFARLGAPAGASMSADVADVEGKVDDLESRLTAARAGYLDNINNAALATTVAQSGDAYSRLGAPAGASVSADVASIKADTGTTIPGRLPTGLTAGGNIKADMLAISGDAIAADNAEAFFDGTGYIGLGNTLGTVLIVAGDVQGNVDGTVGGIGASGLTAIADAILKRDWTAVTGEASRSLLNALRFLRNKWSVSGSTLTVTKEDDATSAWTATLSTDAAADPVTGSDPA